MTFVAPAQRPGREAELARYRLHRNSPDDAGYRAFLGRLVEALAPRLQPPMDGLDYGSGPGPTLSRMLEEKGHRVRLYDPFFAPDAAALRRRYDFITCTETVEHFHRPTAELRRLDRLLRPGGWLGIMTGMRRAGRPLRAWWYAQDPTHVCFYERRTMLWIARRHDWRALFPRPDIVLFRKPPATDA